MAKGSGFSAGQGATAEEALRWAKAALGGGRSDEALRIANDVLKRHPRQAGALQVVGCAYLLQGRPRDAIAPLEAAARVLHDPEADTQLAIALRQAGQNDDALNRLMRAVKRQRPFVGAFRELGFLLFSMRRHDEAADALTRGIAIAPMSPDLYVQLGNVMMARLDGAAARRAYGQALAINPDNADALLGLGLAHAEDREYAAAAAIFRRLLLRTPNDANTLINLGQCLLGLGQLEAGYDCFRTVSRGGPQRQARALSALVKSSRGRFWLRPRDAARFFRAS